ncbi:MAG: glycoside hydrolase family 88 protein, partial [Polyangiaceae bacterium]
MSACSIDERLVGGQPGAGEGDTPGEPGAPPPGNDELDTDDDGASPDDSDLAGPAGGGDVTPPDGLGNAEGAGGTSSAGVENGAGGTDVVPGETVPEVIASTVDKFFGDWPAGTDPLTVGTRAAEIFTSQSLASGSGHDNEDDYKHYKDACAWYGSLAVARLGGQQSLFNALVAKYQPYVGTWGAFDPPTTQNSFAGLIDDSTFGIVPLEIAKFNPDPVYAQEGDLAADHQVAFIATQLRNASDDMFHVATLQMQAYRVSSDAGDRQRHMDTAAASMVTYLRAMQKTNGLIPHHLDQPGFDVSWSRGNGWFASGLAELMSEIPSTHPDYVTIEAGYQRMMNGLL